MVGSSSCMADGVDDWVLGLLVGGGGSAFWLPVGAPDDWVFALSVGATHGWVSELVSLGAFLNRILEYLPLLKFDKFLSTSAPNPP